MTGQEKGDLQYSVCLIEVTTLTGMTVCVVFLLVLVSTLLIFHDKKNL